MAAGSKSTNCVKIDSSASESSCDWVPQRLFYFVETAAEFDNFVMASFGNPRLLVPTLSLLYLSMEMANIAVENGDLEINQLHMADQTWLENRH